MAKLLPIFGLSGVFVTASIDHGLISTDGTIHPQTSSNAADQCLVNKNNKVTLRDCKPSKSYQRWFTTDDDSTHFHIVSEADKKCWAVKGINAKTEKLIMLDCDPSDNHQIFEFVNGKITHKEGSQDFCLTIKTGKRGVKMQSCHVNRFGLIRAAAVPPVQVNTNTNVCLNSWHDPSYPCHYTEKCIWTQPHPPASGDWHCRECANDAEGQSYWGANCEYLNYCKVGNPIQLSGYNFWPYDYRYEWVDDGTCNSECEYYGRMESNDDSSIQLYIQDFGATSGVGKYIAVQICGDDLTTIWMDKLVGNYFTTKPNYDVINDAYTNYMIRSSNIRIQEINEEFFRPHGDTLTGHIRFPATLLDIPDKLLLPLRKVTKLTLWESTITHLGRYKFMTMEKLTDLDLAGNQINQLLPNVFYGLVSCDSIHLNRNKIEEIGSNVFVGLHKLTQIYLDENQISTIAMDAFDDVKDTLTSLDLSGNNLVNLGNMPTRTVLPVQFFVGFLPGFDFDGEFGQAVGSDWRTSILGKRKRRDLEEKIEN